MKRIHTLIATLICTAAFAASSLASLSYGAELPVTQVGSEVSNLRTTESEPCGENLSWSLDYKGTLTISGTGKMWDYDVNHLSPWYNSRSDVKTVVIENGVTSIGDYAFFGCAMTEITIPAGVTSIGFAAFSNCSSLHNISFTIPSNMTYIGNAAFSRCSSLQSITIPSGVTSIGEQAFLYCSSLQSITIPSGVESIETGVFYSCTNLQSITIPATVTSIGDAAFQTCSSLKSITIPAGVKRIENTTFSGCTSLESVTIPVSLEIIGDYAFNGCSKLGTVYYNGSESDWNKINFGEMNESLTFDKVHFIQIVWLDKESLTLTPGETAVLSAVINPQTDILAETFERPFIWSSADPEIAKVDDNGTVTAVAEGETTVTAMSAVCGYSADCSVVVKKADPIVRTKPANTFVGGQNVDVKSLYFSSHPEATRFQSSSKKIASVNKKGIMKAKKPGIVTIEAQTGKKKAERKTVSSCSLIILEKPKLKFKVKYSAASDIGKVLDGYEFFTTASTKQTAADLWESSKPAVAEINPETGVITIKGKGTAAITAYFGKKGEKGTLKVKAKLKVKK